MQNGLQSWLVGEACPMAANPQVSLTERSRGSALGTSKADQVQRQWQDVCGAKVLARDQPEGLLCPRTLERKGT